MYMYFTYITSVDCDNQHSETATALLNSSESKEWKKAMMQEARPLFMYKKLYLDSG